MTTLPATTHPIYDIAIVGGGINGAAIARDAALRGLSVYLCEQNDLAGATSSASSKIIHGGLRYLESREFSMVRKSLKEREVLLGIAPHLVTPLGFILPHSPDSKVSRPRWLIRLGLFVYDHLYRSKRLPKTRALDFDGTSAGKPLQNTYKKGFLYSDGWADDARLVVLTAVGAAKHGATIAPRTKCDDLKRDGNIWQLTVRGEQGSPYQIQARTVVNATGPWAEKFLKNTKYAKESQPLTLVKGSHIVVPKLFDHQNAYALQARDGRVVFVFPYEKQFTLIGTTDTPFDGDPSDAMSDEDEIQYLCDVVNGTFKKQITPEDTVWTYSGVRPLLSVAKGGGESPSKLSRDYSLQLNAELGLLSAWGGKLTAHRQLAQEAVDKLCRALGSNRPCQTATAPLPGGDMAPEDLPTGIRKLQGEHPWLTAATATRVVHAYGTHAEKIFAGKDTLKELGQHFGGGLYQVEVDYLIKNEWAQTAEDVLWRRSKLGLHIGLAGQAALKDYMQDYMKA